MNKKENYIVLDVETTGKGSLVYDLGFIVTNKENEIKSKHHFLIKEIFNNKELMNTSYYKAKIPTYLEMLANDEITMISFEELYKAFNCICELYQVKKIFAFNCNFDKSALNRTSNALLGCDFFYHQMEYCCIQHMACQVLLTQITFIKEALNKKWLTDVGNIQSKAEIVYRYISNDDTFDEDHMGLQDVMIENEILDRCWRQHKKMDLGINSQCWKIPNKFFDENHDLFY